MRLWSKSNIWNVKQITIITFVDSLAYFIIIMVNFYSEHKFNSKLIVSVLLWPMLSEIYLYAHFICNKLLFYYCELNSCCNNSTIDRIKKIYCRCIKWEKGDVISLFVFLQNMFFFLTLFSRLFLLLYRVCLSGNFSKWFSNEVERHREHCNRSQHIMCFTQCLIYNSIDLIRLYKYGITEIQIFVWMFVCYVCLVDMA